MTSGIKEMISGHRERVLAAIRTDLAAGASFKDVRTKARKLGVKLAYNPHEKVGGAAARRRSRQMERGIIPAVCITPECGREVPKGRDVRLCDGCLAEKWGRGL
jgi:hypothetical protein